MIINVNPVQHIQEDGSVEYAKDSIVFNGEGSIVYTTKGDDSAVDVEGEVVRVGNLTIISSGDIPMVIKNFTLHGRYKMSFWKKLKNTTTILKAYWTGSHNVILD